MTSWWMIFNSAPVLISKKVHIVPNIKYLERLLMGARKEGEDTVKIAVIGKADGIRFPAGFKVKIKDKKSLISPYDTYFNFTIFTLQIGLGTRK